MSTEKYEVGKQMYKDGVSLTKISKELHISRTHFTKYLKDNGVNIINQQNTSDIYSDIFDVIDTEEKAYWLGFLYADGYIHKTYLELGLKESDLEHIKKFKEFLNTRNKICYRPDTHSYRIIINNKHLTDSLKNKGCIERKSYLVSFPSEDIVPKHLIKHFVRGVVDGDGYVGSKILTLGKIRGRLGLVSAVPDFLEDIRLKMNWHYAKIKKDKRNSTHSIEWGGAYVIDMLDDLYKGANIYLDRKYQKYIDLKTAVAREAT